MDFIIRDNDGNVILAASKRMQAMSMSMVEFQAAWSGLMIAVMGHNFQSIWLEGDSTVVIKYL